MQVNLSLTPDTKECLTSLQSKMHCTSLSDVITRLAWDEKHRYDSEEEQRQIKFDRSDNFFSTLAFMFFAEYMIQKFTISFKAGYVYSLREFKILYDRGELTDDIIDKSFIYTLCSTKHLPANSIVKCSDCMRNKNVVEDITNVDELSMNYWSADDICGIKRGDIVINVVTSNCDGSNKIGEELPKDTKLCFRTAVGFEIKHKSGKSIVYIWNEILNQFDMSFT